MRPVEAIRPVRMALERAIFIFASLCEGSRLVLEDTKASVEDVEAKRVEVKFEWERLKKVEGRVC